MRFPASVMEIDNPFFQPDAPVWEGEDLPLSVNAGSLEVTLKSLRLEGSGALRAEVDLSEPGWYGEPFAWMEDATGNVGTHLSPFESAWKVHVRLAPSHFGKQSPEHVWTIPDVAVPDAGGVTALDMTKVIDGVTLRVQSISGGASSGRSESQSSSSAEAPPAGAPSFAIQADADHNKFVVHTRILSNGESIGLGMRTGIGEKQLTIEAPFRLPPEGQKVTLEITCLRKRDVEFLVKPPAELRNALMAEGKAP